jgi:uncharacterized protein
MVRLAVHRKLTPQSCLVGAALCWLVLVAAATAQKQLPADRLLNSLTATADVNDFAAILNPAQRQSLEDRCAAVREKTGAQLAVVTLKSLEGGQIDDFAEKLFARWGIGQKDKKNGVLLLVAIDDRKARVEVGYGLEPILPDALAGRILTEELFPAFRQQRYADGLAASVNRIAELIERNEPAPAVAQRKGGDIGDTLFLFLFLSAFVAAGGFVCGLALGTKKGPLVLFGLLFFGVPLLIGCAAAFPWAPLLHLPLGMAAAFAGWRSGKGGGFGSPGGQAGGWGWAAASPTTWDWSSSAGSSSWSSGGGFSGGGSDWGGFGGGSSGGGGASGGW